MASLRHGLRQALSQIDQPPDLLLITGDLCQDESWGGYRRLQEVLEDVEPLREVPLALTPGNHDHPALMRSALGRRAVIAPAALDLGDWTLLLLSSHRSGAVAGFLDPRQLAWLERQLELADQPVVLALHHPRCPLVIQAWIRSLCRIQARFFAASSGPQPSKPFSSAMSTSIGRANCPAAALGLPYPFGPVPRRWRPLRLFNPVPWAA